MRAMAIRFKRAQNSRWEYGIGVTRDGGTCDVIVDQDGKPVPSEPQIWTFDWLPHDGCISVTFPEPVPEKDILRATFGERFPDRGK